MPGILDLIGHTPVIEFANLNHSPVRVLHKLEKFNAGGFGTFTGVVSGLGIPGAPFWGVFIPLLELIGGLMVLLGLYARWVAVLFVVEYFVTSFLLKVPRQPPFGGWDSMRIDLMLLATAVTLVLVGPGALALDALVLRRRASGAQRATARA